jgi:heme/copper-type cytochrome/quinol oxidase subunit 4
MKQNLIKKHVITGFLVGIIATAIGFYVYTQLIYSYSIKFIKRLIIEEQMLGMLLIYSIIPTLIAFFIFTKQKQDYKAKGVLLATFLVALVTLFSKFIF